MFGQEDLQRLAGTTVYDEQRDKIGKVGTVYLDDATGEPTWMTVNTGFFGTSESFVPLAQARWDGDDLVVPHRKDTVKDAPRVDADQHLGPSEEQQLYAYYNMDGSAQDVGGRPDPDAQVVKPTNHSTGERDVAGDGDVAMTLSEERLNVDKEQVETGRARLRKYVVTEDQTVTVPVQKETLRVERQPAGEHAQAGEISDTGDVVEEIVLREERPVVSKETVAVEEVRVSKDVETEQQQVSEQVQKEQVDIDGDGVVDEGSSNR